MATADPIFKSTRQALHIAFALEVTRMAQKGATAVLIADLMTQRYGSGWQERGEVSLDLGNLSPVEFRAQCAAIRKTVTSKLLPLQRDCVHARYAFGTTQLTGVSGVRDFFRSLCNTRSDSAVEALVMGIYLGKSKRNGENYSLRKIEDKFGVARSVLHRDQQLVKAAATKIEERAVFELNHVFEEAGLVAS